MAGLEEGGRIGFHFHGLHTDNAAGPRYRIDALRIPAAEGREGRGERECGEDHIYQELGRERQREQIGFYLLKHNSKRPPTKHTQGILDRSGLEKGRLGHGAGFDSSIERPWHCCLLPRSM
jgi:hypothetical protein